MSAIDTDALVEALNLFIKQGHSFTLAPAGGIDGTPYTQASISGPSGSRSSFKPTPAEALEDLIVQVVNARLSGDSPSTIIGNNPSVGIFDDLGPDSYF